MSLEEEQEHQQLELFELQASPKEWEVEWQGMPEFESEDQYEKIYQKIIIRFETKEHFEAFAKLIGQNLTAKTQSIWYPKLIHKDWQKMRYFDET